MNRLEIERGRVVQSFQAMAPRVDCFDVDHNRDWIVAGLTGSYFSGLMLWDLAEPDEPWVLPMKTPCKTIALRPHQPQIAWTSGQTIHFFNIRTGSETLSVKADVYILRIQFSADGQSLVVSGTDHESVYDANTGELQFTMTPDRSKPPPPIVCRKILDIDAAGRVWALAEQTKHPRKPILAQYSPQTQTWETLILDLGGLPLVAPTIISADGRLLAIPIIEPNNTMPRIGIDV
jgi:WD40 repeat protein